MQAKPIAVVLGGTSPHIALIENLKRRGYHTVLIDYYENPPAAAAADEHIQESTLELDKVLTITRTLNAKLIISACVDQANVTACHVAEEIGLPAPYSYETALNVTNKGLMKKKMIEGGIPTSKYIVANNSSDFKKSDLKFPVVVKPEDSCGSKGVKRANNFLELNDRLQEAIAASRSKRAIIEEYKDGIEINFDCFVKNKTPNIILAREKCKIIAYNESVMQFLGSIIPAKINNGIMERIQRIATDISFAFNLENTPLLIQTIINRNEINVIEFAPRIGGGVNFRTIEQTTNFDIIDAAVNSYLGTPTDIKFRKAQFHYSTNHIYAFPGIFGYIAGYDELIKNEVIDEFFFVKTKGMQISRDMSTGSRVGSFTIKAKTRKELMKKMTIAIKSLDVFDIDGKPVMRKDIYDNFNWRYA